MIGGCPIRYYLVGECGYDTVMSQSGFLNLSDTALPSVHNQLNECWLKYQILQFLLCWTLWAPISTTWFGLPKISHLTNYGCT